jgi:aldose 1-epimerase
MTGRDGGGRSFESESVRVEVLPSHGARLHSLRAYGHEVLLRAGHPDAYLADPFFLGAYVMAPWCNRVAPGPTALAGQTIDLVPNFSDGSAIHGQVYVRPWRQVSEAEFSVNGGGHGWPWPYEVRLGVATEAASVRLALRLLNLGDGPMPAGLGLHPWFVKPVEVAINAARAYAANVNSENEPAPVAGERDLRRLAPLPDGLDGTWTDLDEPPLELRWPRAGVACRLRFDAPARYLAAASPSDVGGVAIEPQTHAPQGLRRLLKDEPGAMAMLDPGAELALSIAMSFERF